MSLKTLLRAIFTVLTLSASDLTLLAQSPSLGVVLLKTGRPELGNFVTTIDSNRAYICTQEGGILKTIDGGESWNEKTVSRSLPLRSMSFPTLTRGYAAGDSGIFRTVDAGATWQNVYVGHLRSISFVNETVGFAAGHFPDGILKTTDGGNSWTRVYQERFCDPVYFVNDLVGFAVPGHPLADTILRTNDAGATWDKVVISGLVKNTGPAAFSFIDDSTGFLVEWEGGIYKSIDAGISWKRIPLDIPGRWYSRSLHFLNSRQGFVVGQNDTNAVIIRTEDGGDHWSVVHTHDSSGITYTGISMASSTWGFVSAVGITLRIEEGDKQNVITAIASKPAHTVVYPNPSKGEIEVESVEGVNDIVVIDAIGREIQRATTNGFTTSLYLNDPGVYIIQLIGPRIRQRFKVVITR